MIADLKREAANHLAGLLVTGQLVSGYWELVSDR
jgi:hypothetical protein